MAAGDRFPQDFREGRADRPLGMRSEMITGPVSDWAADFSHLEPQWAAGPYPFQDDLRRRCPIARTERFGGGWRLGAFIPAPKRHRSRIQAGATRWSLKATTAPGCGRA